MASALKVSDKFAWRLPGFCFKRLNKVAVGTKFRSEVVLIGEFLSGREA
jgi:hypothetical protein